MMATPPVKPEHMLQGSSNFSAWKTRVMNTFVEFDPKDLVTREAQAPPQMQDELHSGRSKRNPKGSSTIPLRIA